MKFTIDQKDLLPILSQCAAVADRKGTMPALAMCHIAAFGPESPSVAFSATDLYQSVSAYVTTGAVKEPGSIAVNARDLLDRVKALPGEISCTVDGSTLTLKSGSRRFRLPTIPGDEMPKLPDPDGATLLFSIPGEELAQLISRVHYAISTDETRLHLNSLLLEHSGDKLTAVATDGHRLCVAVQTWDTGRQTVAPFQVLLPLKGVMQLKRLSEAAGDVTLRQQGYTLFVEAGGYEWTCKLTDAQFPPYQQVIPADHPTAVIVSRQQLLDAVRAVKVAANDRTGTVKLSFGAESIRVSSESPGGGEADDEVSCKLTKGSPVDVGVNAAYLEQALGVIDADHVEIKLGEELDPLTIRADGDESGSVAVVMPCRS